MTTERLRTGTRRSKRFKGLGRAYRKKDRTTLRDQIKVLRYRLSWRRKSKGVFKSFQDLDLQIRLTFPKSSCNF
jgi:intergrase/recombinase